MVTISLCMIVKNEEAVLERCLNSVSDLVDEIVIVDTDPKIEPETSPEPLHRSFMSCRGMMILPQPETRLSKKRKWNTVCGWMRTM